jgi:hypothetical protein
VLLSAQAGLHGLPHNLRLSLAHVNAREIPELLATLREATIAALEDTAPEIDTASVASLDVSTLDDATFGHILFTLGITDGADGDVAAINRLLCSLSPDAREVAVLRYLSALTEAPINHHT